MAKRGGGRRGGGSGSSAAGEVTHSVVRQERNLIWELARDVWRPVRHPDHDKAVADALKNYRKPPVDPRSGHPVHARPGRPEGGPAGRYGIPRDRHEAMAADLGYSPTSHTGVEGLPIFHKPGGKPPYIVYDQDGHATVPRDPVSNRQIPYDPANPDTTAPAVAWKGADNPAQLTNRTDRSGTYIPTYDDKGNVVFRQPRAGK